MADAHGKTRRSPETPTPAAALDLVGAANLDPFLQAGNRLMAGWVAVGTEILEFGRARLDQSLAISKALAQSASIEEALGLQSQYAKTVLQDYVAEANKIVDLGTRSLLDTLSPLRHVPETVAKHAEAAE